MADIHSLVTEITPLPISVIQSHAHNDHIGGAWQFDDVGIHPSEASDLVAGQSGDTALRPGSTEPGMSGPLPPGFDPVGYSIPGKVPTRTYNDGDIVDLGGTNPRGDPCSWSLPRRAGSDRPGQPHPVFHRRRLPPIAVSAQLRLCRSPTTSRRSSDWPRSFLSWIASTPRTVQARFHRT